MATPMSMQETLENIARPLPPRAISTRKQGGNTLSYISWHTACTLMDQRAPGWSYEVKHVGQLAGKTFVLVSVSIPCVDGVITRDGIGNEDSDTDSWGDPFSNSESMAIRRAFAKFGLGLELYRKGQPAPLDAPVAKTNGKPAAAPHFTPRIEAATSTLEAVAIIGDIVKADLSGPHRANAIAAALKQAAYQSRSDSDIDTIRAAFAAHKSSLGAKQINSVVDAVTAAKATLEQVLDPALTEGVEHES